MGCWVSVNWGLCFLPSREKTGAAQPPAPVCLSREWGAGAVCQAAGVGGHASPLWSGPVSVSRRDTVWTERTCLSVNTAAFVSCRPRGSLLPEVFGSPRAVNTLKTSRRQLLGRTPAWFHSLAWPISPSRVWFKEYF